MSNRSKEITTTLLGLLGEALLYYSIDHFVTAIIPLFYSLLAGKPLSSFDQLTVVGTIIASLSIALFTFFVLRRLRKKTLLEKIKQELEECASKYFAIWKDVKGLLTSQERTPSVMWPPDNYSMLRLADSQYLLQLKIIETWWDYERGFDDTVRKKGMSDDRGQITIDHAKTQDLIFRFSHLVGRMKILGADIFKEFPMPKPNTHWWERKEFQSLKRKEATKMILERYEARIKPLIEKGDGIKSDLDDVIEELEKL